MPRNKSWSWFEAYLSTYVEKDLRDLLQVKNLSAFQKTYKMLGFQSGNLVNLNNISNELGVDHNTIKSYVSILETSYQCNFLRAYFSNKRKQLIKSPKIFFTDTGLINYFYKNRNIEEMLNTGNWGSILESHVYQELYKESKLLDLKPDIYFWRTNNGSEIDFIIDTGKVLYPIEVKSSIRIDSHMIRGLKSFIETEKKTVPFGIVLYRGREVQYLAKNILAIPLTMVF